ncbi:HD domain-containing protein [Duganella sp. HSC-15S17]|uniref:HD domain-containing protein n=1 Tax=Duganella violaceipulchra TaxID=2849652 RepID=A0AA41L443_9BURK|nr:HD domain-containing protein [Duganella violaceicalia]MCP2010686.1 response regulator RpfG family c-di-GMP phosphodiesterase [Duganella violaceicalia]
MNANTPDITAISMPRSRHATILPCGPRSAHATLPPFALDSKTTQEQEIAHLTKETQASQDMAILALAALAEIRDDETGSHILRTQLYIRSLAERLRDHPRFVGFFTPENIALLYKSAPLHDIGKVGIPDSILRKPGRLDADEFEIMKTHTTLGYEVLAQAETRLGKAAPFLIFAKEISQSHHEKWDGSGYPQGLVGDAIPISARLMALADVYDALISRRVYKEPFSHEDAVAMIARGRGQHFDPDMVDAFLSIQEDWRMIAAHHADQALATP